MFGLIKYISLAVAFVLIANLQVIAGFIENKGQWDNHVKYLYQTTNLNVWITDESLVFDNYKIQLLKSHGGKHISGHVISMKMENLNKSVHFIPISKHQEYYNYFIGNNQSKWASGVPVFEECKIKNVWNGVDLSLHSEKIPNSEFRITNEHTPSLRDTPLDRGDKLENFRYDFIVAPGASTQNIQFSFEGCDDIKINTAGELVFNTSIGELNHGKIFAWQLIGTERKEVACCFERVTGNKFTIKTADYDKTKELIIDPLVYSTFIGGSAYEEVKDIKTDALGNVYICGNTNSNNFPTIPGGYDQSYNGNYDAFVSKLNSDGSGLIFSTFIGSDEDDKASSLDIDASGNVFVTGLTASSSFPITMGAYDMIANGEFDAFVLKLGSSGGNLLYSTFLGGSIYDEAKSIVIDNMGYAFVTGKTYSADFPVTSGSYDEMFGGGQDIFVCKIGAEGTTLDFSTYIGGAGIDIANSIDLDVSKNVYITGETESDDYPTTGGAFDISFNGGRDVIVSKFNSSLNALMYSTFIGGSANDAGYGITIDNSSNAIICGETISGSYPTTFGSYDLSFNGGVDGIVSKLNSTGSSLVFSTFMGGTGDDRLCGIELDNSNNIYLAGYSGSIDFPVSSNAVGKTNSGAYDAVIVRLLSAGNSLGYSSYLGGAQNEESYAIALSSDLNAIICGSTASSDFPSTSGCYDNSFNGQIDGFVSKVSGLDVPTITTGYVLGEYCAGSKFNVNYTVSSNFSSGNEFIAELSNSSGDFSNPDTIGTISSVTSGSMLVTLPKNLTTGYGYRIRIVASNPESIGTDNGENIAINELPAMNIDGNFEPCSGKTYTYSTNSDMGFAYLWSVTGGDLQGNNNSSSIVILWGTDSLATIQLIKRSLTTNCTDTLSYDIMVKFPPVTEIGYGKYEVCVGEIVEYISAGGSVATDNWVVQGGTVLSSDGSKARVRWNYAGNGWIEMQKTSEFGCVGKDKRDVIVNPIPTAQIYGNSNAYSGKRTLYKSMVEAGTGSWWQVIGGTTQDSTSDSVYITWGQPGTGWLRLIKYYQETDCSDTAELNITINPGLPAGEIEGKNQVCSDNIEPYSTEQVDNTYIRWYVKGGSIIGADNGFDINVNWKSAGAGEVKYVLTEYGSGNKDSVSLSVTINPTPDINFPQLPDICENGEPISLNMAEPVGGDYSGEGVDMDYFYPDRVGVGSNEITYSFTNQFGCEGTKTITIVVNPKPEKPVISSTSQGFISNYDEGNQWFLNGEAIEGETGKELINHESGVFSVQVTDSNGCVSDMSNQIEVAVEDILRITGLSIYPNPAENHVLIKNESNDIIRRIEIIDIFGNKVLGYSSDLMIQDKVILQKLNISEINNGFYIIKLYFSDFIVAEKLIINH
ncbi:MAG: SBBP repeat-containing protein [bacterium]